MFRLFRGIRQKLINDAKFGKYMLYAIGEVLILIFGILIALQVNIWNEKAQNIITEISLLTSMKKELEKDLEDIDMNIKVHKLGINAAQTIIDHLENDLDYNDSLAIHFLDTSISTLFEYQEGSYVTLQSLGVGLISNDSLRNQIIELYAKYEVIIRAEGGNMARMEHAENNIFSSRFDQLYYFETNVSLVTDYGKMIPLDYEALKHDDEYKFFVKTYKNANKQYLIWWMDPARAMVVNLISNIEKELIVLQEESLFFN